MPDLIIRLHPAVVHFPIAFLLLSSGAGLLYLYWQPRPELRVLTWWPMALGWIGGGLAVLTGLLAQSNLPAQPPYGAILNWHIGTGLAMLVVYGDLLYRRWLWQMRRNRGMGKPADVGTGGAFPQDWLDEPDARLWVTGLLLLGAALVVASGWNGGRLVYEWGVNVARPS